MPYVEIENGSVVGVYRKPQPTKNTVFVENTDRRLLRLQKQRLKQRVNEAANEAAIQVQDLDKRTRRLAEAIRILAGNISIKPADRAALKEIADVFDVDIQAIESRRAAKEKEIDALGTQAELDAYDVKDFS